MSVSSLPLATGLANYRFSVDLDGSDFRFHFIYNSRDESWYMTILDGNDNPLRSGIRVVSEWALIRLWRSLDAPLGEIISLSLGENDEPPDLDQLGVETLLTYIDGVHFA